MNRHNNYIKNNKQLGGYDELNTAFLRLDGSIIKATKLHDTTIPTKVLPDSSYYDHNYEDILMYHTPSYTKYEYNNNDSKIIIENMSKRIVVEIFYTHDRIPSKKIFYFYIPNTVYKIEITQFEQDDKSYTKGNGIAYITTDNDNVILRGSAEITSPRRRARVLSMTIKSITIYGYTININDVYAEHNTKKLPEMNMLLANDSMGGTYQKFLTRCSLDIRNSNIFTINKFQYPATERSLVNTVCQNLFYNIPVNGIVYLNQHKRLFRYIVTSSAHQMNPNVDHIIPTPGQLGQPQLYYDYMNTINKYVPSQLTSNDIEIRARGGAFVALNDPARPRRFKVIFDSGNAGSTFIGQDIVTHLGLQPIPGFRFRAMGVGGVPFNQSGDVVRLDFRLADTYPEYDGKEYSILAFVSTSMPDTLLFGHRGGLTNLFKDKYSIKGKFNDMALTNTIRREDNLSESAYMEIAPILQRIANIIHHPTVPGAPRVFIPQTTHIRSELDKMYHGAIVPHMSTFAQVGRYNTNMDIDTVIQVYTDLNAIHTFLQERQIRDHQYEPHLAAFIDRLYHRIM